MRAGTTVPLDDAARHLTLIAARETTAGHPTRSDAVRPFTPSFDQTVRRRLSAPPLSGCEVLCPFPAGAWVTLSRVGARFSRVTYVCQAGARLGL
jgi:hypothetical protein